MPIARLIADPEQLDSLLDPFGMELVSSSAELHERHGDWVEIRTAPGTFPTLLAACQKYFADADVLVSDQVPVVPQVFVSDMDSTMIGQECIDELADYAGIKDQIADITERAMQGELDFESALRERVGLLAGLDEGAIQQCLDERIRPNPGARVLVETLKALGCRTALVTGGFHHFADPVAAQIGFEHVAGNRLAVADGKLTGGLIGEVCGSATKQQVLEQMVASAGQGAVSLGAGDGANDIPMLQAATFGMAYYAKPKARAAANGWINRGDLTSILRLLGIPTGNWVG